jgi:DtxR family Mn-dependent transcriptional regulator
MFLTLRQVRVRSVAQSGFGGESQAVVGRQIARPEAWVLAEQTLMSPTDLTRSEREALKAIYRFTRDGSEAHTGALAERLSLSPGTVTTLVKRLADRGLVDHRPYQGVHFTDEGRRAAVAAIRRHRIGERFLADMLGSTWNEADELAVAVEHELPDEVTERLFVALHRPANCPHGFPIPRPEAHEVPDTPELYDLEPGDVAEVAVSGSTDAEILSFLGSLGVVPGVEVAVVEKHPFDGPLVVRIEGETRTIGQRVARQVYVTRTIGSSPGDDRNGRAGGTGETSEPVGAAE